MSKLDDLYSNAPIAAQQQALEILQSGKTIKTSPGQPQKFGKFKSKITDLEKIIFEDYENGRQLEEHLRVSGFKAFSPEVKGTLERFLQSEHGQKTIQQTRLEDLY